MQKSSMMMLVALVALPAMGWLGYSLSNREPAPNPVRLVPTAHAASASPAAEPLALEGLRLDTEPGHLGSSAPEGFPNVSAASEPSGTAPSPALLTKEKREALKRLQARMDVAMAGNKANLKATDVVNYLNELEKIVGTSKFGGMDIAALRSQIELADQMRIDVEHVQRLMKLPSRSAQEEAELQRRKARLQETQGRLVSIAGLGQAPARVPN